MLRKNCIVICALVLTGTASYNESFAPVLSHVVFTGFSAIKAATSWGDILYPSRRQNKHSYMKPNYNQEDTMYKSYLIGKAVIWTGACAYFGNQFFKNFQK
jgi:hypothetical protein